MMRFVLGDELAKCFDSFWKKEDADASCHRNGGNGGSAVDWDGRLCAWLRLRQGRVRSQFGRRFRQLCTLRLVLAHAGTGAHKHS
jgi:hypothetical protein